MIEKERLQELIEQEETVWCVSELWGSNKLNLHNKDVRDSDCFHISKTLLLSDSIEFYDEEETYKVPFQLLFETEQEYLKHKEEAEFIKKYHTKRIEKFEPPYRLKENERFHFTSKKGAKMSIHKFRDGEWWLSYVGTHRYCETYEEAVERAYKLFKGEE